MDKLTFTKLFSINDDNVSFVENRGASDVWPFFLKVYVDNVFSENVLCSKCKAILKWKSRDCTSRLKAPIKSCAVKTESPKITRFLMSTSETTKQILKTEKLNFLMPFRICFDDFKNIHLFTLNQMVSEIYLFVNQMI